MQSPLAIAVAACTRCAADCPWIVARCHLIQSRTCWALTMGRATQPHGGRVVRAYTLSGFHLDVATQRACNHHKCTTDCCLWLDFRTSLPPGRVDQLLWNLYVCFSTLPDLSHTHTRTHTHERTATQAAKDSAADGAGWVSVTCDYLAGCWLCLSPTHYDVLELKLKALSISICHAVSVQSSLSLILCLPAAAQVAINEDVCSVLVWFA